MQRIIIAISCLFLLTACEVRIEDDALPAPTPELPDIHEAVLDSDMNALRRHYQAGGDFNARNEQGLTPLHLAIALDDRDLVRQLLDWGADPDVTDEHGSSPLHMAASRDLRHATHLLIRGGAGIEARDGKGHTPAEIAHYMDHTEVVDFLIAAGADDPREREAPEERPAVSPSPDVLAELRTPTPPSEEYQTWTSIGREEVSAQFLGITNDMVVLRTPDDQTIRVPVPHLQEADRERAMTMRSQRALE